jgi:5-methylcytosine-specific restriction endonuclease McrA
MMITKTCTKCGETKPVDLFYKRSDQVGKFTSHCRACKRSHDNAHVAKPETKKKRSEYAKKYRSNPENILKQNQYRYFYYRTEEYRSRGSEKAKNRRLDPEIAKKIREYDVIRAKQNPAYFAFKTRSRKAKKLQRTPQWMNAAHHFEIECVYKYCSVLRAIGLDYEVDHVIPLQGKIVSGLHLPWNLQVLHASENARKGNRL